MRSLEARLNQALEATGGGVQAVPVISEPNGVVAADAAPAVLPMLATDLPLQVVASEMGVKAEPLVVEEGAVVAHVEGVPSAEVPMEGMALPVDEMLMGGLGVSV